MSDSWKKQYFPKDYVDENIYNNVMDPIQENEWLEAIRDLPLDKASGPSLISNEMIKHAGSTMLETLRFMANACLRIGDIPGDWKDAQLYPIPKPYDWEYDISKTRPITLLETVRKL